MYNILISTLDFLSMLLIFTALIDEISLLPKLKNYSLITMNKNPIIKHKVQST